MSNTENTGTSDLQKVEALEDLFDLFAVDKKRATGGVPFKIGGTTFTVARANNPRHAAFIQGSYAELYEKYPKDTDRETQAFSDALDAKIKEGIQKHVILGWDKIKLNGKVYEGPSEEGYKLLMQLDDLLDVILNFAGNRRNYAPTLTGEDTKN